jgi:hypothetical protein
MPDSSVVSEFAKMKTLLEGDQKLYERVISEGQIKQFGAVIVDEWALMNVGHL